MINFASINLKSKIMKTTLFSLIAALFLFSGCSSTTLVGSWVDPELKSIEGKNIAIFCLTPRLDVRDKVETEMSEAFQAKGANVMRSMDFITPGKMEKEVVQKILETNNITGVIIVSLLDKEKETTYVPGSSTYYGGGYYGYYGARYTAVYDPGYYSTTTSYFLECNAYRLSDGKLGYTAQTKAVDPSSLDKFAYDFSRQIVNDLISKGVVLGAEVKK
jgi:hypothetical protein